MALSNDQIKRYSRQLILNDLGVKGQKKLLSSKVLVIGAGGLGSPASLYLAAAGVGTIGIADDDAVDLSNLQRQILHSTADLGRPKVESAEKTLTALNPDVRVVAYHERVVAANVMDMIEPYDFVIDAVDNAQTKFLINDACVLAQKPYVHAGILQWGGQALTYVPGEGPCMRCIFEDPPANNAGMTCSEVGILGVVAGTMGCIEASEAIKYLLGSGKLLTGRMLVYDALGQTFTNIDVPSKNPECKVCGDHPTIHEPFDYEPISCKDESN